MSSVQPLRIIEPAVKRVVAFIDGQNLFHAVREGFGYSYPNFDPLALARRVCQDHGWQFDQARFYTGVPDLNDSPHWNYFWNSKLAVMGHQGVHVYSRSLRYRTESLTLPDGTSHRHRVGKEKGIDIRIALDIISLAHKREYDVGLIFSQDQDLSEAADEIRVIAAEQSRWIKLASAFPTSPDLQNRRGINSTDWIKFDRATYNACLDPRDHRPPRPQAIVPPAVP